MTENEIESFYNHYKNSISAVDTVENKLLKCSYSFEKWSESLNEKSRTIRKIYESNDELVAKLLNITLDTLTEETADKLITHIDFFMSEGYRDYQVVVSVLDILIEFYKKNGSMPRLFDCYYFMASELIEVYEYEKACEYYRRALELYEGQMESANIYRRFKIMCSYYYRLVAAVCDKNASQNTVLSYFYSAKKMWVDEPVIDFVTDKKRRGIENILTTLSCITVENALLNNEEVRVDFLRIIEKEYITQKDILGDEVAVNTGIYVTYHKLRREYGMITKGEYNNYICKKYNFESEKEKIFSYGKTDFIELFDDETLDEDFEVSKLCYMSSSYMYINSLIPEMIDIFKRNDFMDEIERYYSNFPIVSGNYLVDYMIADHMKKIFRYSVDESEVIHILEKVFMNRQITTLIHSNMVSKLAAVITGRLISSVPEIFVGQFGIKTVSGVLVNRNRILDYVENAGMIHDIGKIMYSDIINLQSRKISDRELSIIKKHPKKAAEILRHIPSLREYSDVALGHHKSYDGKRGYPEDFDNTKSDYRVFIDIIRICDFIDAATDFLGRNYTGVKEFRTILDELKFGRGTSYSAVIIDQIINDEFLIRSIEKITGEERQHMYYDIYHNMIEPGISYCADDELVIRHYEDNDEESVIKITGRSKETLKSIIDACDNNVYVIVNGKGNLFGYICLKDRDDVLEVVDIFIDKKNRKKGMGSVLLNEIEKMSEKQGFRQITIPVVKEGHYDIFCWRNGYKKSNVEGIMVKSL